MFTSQYDGDNTPKYKDIQDQKKYTQSNSKIAIGKITDQKLPMRRSSPDFMKSGLPLKKAEQMIQSFKLPSLTANNKK